MWTYFKWECREFFTNHKNIAIYLLLLFFSLFYWLQIERNYEIVETVSKENLQASLDTNVDFLETVNLEGETHPSTLQAVAIVEPLVENEKAQLKALAKKDYKELLKHRSQWYFLGSSFNPLYYKDGNIYAGDEAYYTRFNLSLKLQDYAENKETVTLEEINEKTAIDSLIRAQNYLLPIILMVLALVFSMDIIAKDRKHKSLLKGIPLSETKKLLIKFLVSAIGVVVAIFPLSIGFIGIGLQNGFGDISMPVPISYFPNNMPLMNELSFETITYPQFLAQWVTIISLLIACLICINLLAGIWVKNSYFLLLLTLGIPFIDLFYNRFGYGDINKITYLPTSYVRVGDVLTGHRSFFWADVNLNFISGVMTVGSCLIILVIILALHGRLKKLL